MNCAQHPDTAAAAYCCNCGKALCEVCKHDVQGSIFCEPCLASRMRPEGISNYANQPDHERSLLGAVVLIALGVLFLLNNLGFFSFFWIRRFWPVILIVIGLWLFITRQRGQR